MYTSRVSIPSIEETITRSVILSTLIGVKKLMGVPTDTKVIIGDNEFIDKDHGYNGKLQDHSSPRNEEIRLSYHEDSIDDMDLMLLGVSNGSRNIYEDKAISAFIRPVMHRRSLTLNIIYGNKSRSKVNSLVNRLRMMVPTDTMYRVHDIEYYYTLPPEVVKLLDVVNTLKNTHTVPPVDLDDYIANNFDSRIDIMNSHEGSYYKGTLIIREAQTGVQGYLSNDLHNIDKEYNESKGYHTVELTYRIEYEKPVQLMVGYPLAIYNQLIPPEYRVKRVPSVPMTGLRHPGDQSLMEVSARTSPFLSIGKNDTYLRIPPEDTYKIPNIKAYHVRLFTVYCLVDSSVPNDLFYLDEIPNIKFRDEILLLLTQEQDHVGTDFQSIFNFELFEDSRVSGNKVILTTTTEDVDGTPTVRHKLTTTRPMQPTKAYRLGVNILADITILSRPRFKSLQASIEAVDVQATVDTSETVLDYVLELLNVDASTISGQYTVSTETTALDIAVNLKEGVWSTFTKPGIPPNLSRVFILKETPPCL